MLQSPAVQTLIDQPSVLFDLARQGKLAEIARTASKQDLTILRRRAYEMTWKIVFEQWTRRIELRRGHYACSRSVHGLAESCLDRFHDDVEAVIDDLLTHARTPIDNLEGWIVSRLNAATVNGHRRRRGERGALQRPRLPRWLTDRLGDDRWLTTLAVEILTWVGTPELAGSELWPIDTWSHRRATLTGDWTSPVTVVPAELEKVLAVMRSRPAWYADHIERPLGRKQAPLGIAPNDEHAEPLDLVPRHARDDARLHDLAAAAVELLAEYLGRGDPLPAAVREAISNVFAAEVGVGFPDSVPGDPHLVEQISGLMDDPVVVDRIAREVIEIFATS